MRISSAAKREFFFWGAAILFFGLVVGYVGYAVSFIAMEVNRAIITPPPDDELIIRYDFDTLRQLLGEQVELGA